MRTLLRPELTPRMDLAERRYDEVLRRIRELEQYADASPDDAERLAEETGASLRADFGVTVSPTDLLLAYEAEGAEVLAFRITLPDPPRGLSIDRDEVREIVRRIVESDLGDGDDFADTFGLYLSDWYRALLAANLGRYDPTLFNRRRVGPEWITPTVDEIAADLWARSSSGP